MKKIKTMMSVLFIFIITLSVFITYNTNAATGDLSQMSAKSRKYYDTRDTDYRHGAKSVNDATNVVTNGKIDTKVYNFKLTKKSSAEVVTGGCKHSYTQTQRNKYKEAATTTNPDTGNKYITDANPDNTINPDLYALCSTNSENVGFAIKYKNTGTYRDDNGKVHKIDVRLEVEAFDVAEDLRDNISSKGFGDISYIGFTKNSIGVKVRYVDWIKVRYEFYESGTSNLISVKGYTTYWDVDNHQGIRFYDRAKTKLYAPSGSKLSITAIPQEGDVSPSFYVFDNGKMSLENYDNKGQITETFTGSSFKRTYTFSAPGTGDNADKRKHADGWVHNTAVLSGALKDYHDDTPSGENGSKVKVGDKILYLVTLTNGTTTDKTATITDNLSKGLAYEAYAPTSISAPTVTGDDSKGTTLKWSNISVPALSTVKIRYRVRVTEHAYDNGNIVKNNATMKIGNDTWTNELDNPVSPPSKKYYASDTPAGKNNSSVKIGDTIKYRIHYVNDTDAAANIVITDTVSKGLTHNNDAKVGTTAITGSNDCTPSITGGSCLKWTINNVPANGEGDLIYSAKVNANALYIVNNKPVIKVGNQAEKALNQLKNPVPVKEYGGTGLSDNPGWNHHEVLMPDDAKGRVGDDIKYKITLANAKAVDQVVIVTDVLSKGLTYNGDASVTNGTITNQIDPKVNDDTKETTMVWTITVPAGKTAVLNYSAKVNSDAINMVNNKATAQYSGESVIDLAELHNPVPKKQYDIDTAYGMNGKIVQKDDIITYNLGYANGYSNPAKVSLKDTLSKGLYYEPNTAKVCDSNKENCKTLEQMGMKEEITKNEDGSTQVIWTRNDMPSLGIEIIVYDVKVTGETVRVQNDFDISYNDGPYTNIEELKNPVPSKEYAKDTPAGYGETAVAKGNKIKYSIKYVNVAEQQVTATIKDTISKGITYVKGSSKIGNESIDDPVISEDGRTLTWTRQLEKDQEENLTYEVLVTGETKVVNNKASMTYSNNPSYERFLNQLFNPVPQKKYADNTKAGKDGATVKKGDVISYSISYSNVKKEKQTIIITDHLSKGLSYKKGTAKINGKSVEPNTITKDANGTMLVWLTSLEANGKAELVYGAKVTGETKKVQNSANIQYGQDPVIHLNELKNPLAEKPGTTPVPAPNTASPLSIAVIVIGLTLVAASIYFAYKNYIPTGNKAN